MLPIQIQVQTPIPSQAEGQGPQRLALFVPGDMVEATVVTALDTGSLLIMVKGIPVRATSQVLNLKPGEVFQARVELVDGQTILKVEQRVPASGQAQTIVTTPASPARIAEILRTLLPAPAAESLGPRLEHLTNAVREAARQGSLPQNAAVQFERLLQRFALTPAQVTGGTLKDAMLALGLQHEQGLLKGSADPTLKGWLMERLAAAPGAQWVTEAGAALAGLERLQVLNTLNMQTGQPVAFEILGPLLEKLARAVRDAVRQGTLPEHEAARFVGLLNRLGLRVDQLPGGKLKTAMLILGLEHEKGLLKGTEDATLKGWLARQVASSPGSEWMNGARSVLTELERSQVINALNVQLGQPLAFEIPLWLPGMPVARVFVEERDGGQQRQGEAARSFSIVTLLDLGAVGPIRVDAVLRAKRITACVLVARPEMEPAAAALLPTLSRGLAAKGFTVEGLSVAVAEGNTVSGEDLQARVVPGLSLVNTRA